MSATALRRIFVNKETKTLQVSDKSGTPVALANFQKYETVPLAIVIVEPDLETVGPDRFLKVDISPLSLQVSINDTYDDASPLAQQASWAKDETTNVFTGELALNVSALNTYVGNNSTVNAFLEIEWSEGTARTKVVIPITIENAVTSPGSVGPAPVTEYYTKPQTDAQFVKKIMPAGEQYTCTSPNGLWQRIIGVDNGGAPIDQVLPAP